MEQDTNYEEVTITKVSGSREHGWQVTRDDGWSNWIQQDSPVEPSVGMTMRCYGRGTGCTIRGIVLDGQIVYYRTEEEDKEYSENQLYGKDAKDWLERWDAGQSCWTIEMGGIGPGYEQAIHITAAEILRWMIERDIDKDREKIDGRALYEEMQTAMFKVDIIEKLGLSGAQFGAATNVASKLYFEGPKAVMKDERVKDRHIQVSRSYPSY